MDCRIGDTAPAVRQEKVTMTTSCRTVEENAGRHKGSIKYPGGHDHLLCFLPGHLKAEGVDNGVETIHRDGEQDVDLDAGAQVLQVTDNFAGSCTQWPSSRSNLHEDKGSAAQAHQQVCTRHRHHKIVGGWLCSPTPMNDQTDQSISQDGDQPKDPKHQTQNGNFTCGHVIWHVDLGRAGGHAPLAGYGGCGWGCWDSRVFSRWVVKWHLRCERWSNASRWNVKDHIYTSAPRPGCKTKKGCEKWTQIPRGAEQEGPTAGYYSYSSSYASSSCVLFD